MQFNDDEEMPASSYTSMRQRHNLMTIPVDPLEATWKWNNFKMLFDFSAALFYWLLQTFLDISLNRSEIERESRIIDMKNSIDFLLVFTRVFVLTNNQLNTNKVQKIYKSSQYCVSREHKCCERADRDILCRCECKYFLWMN